MEAKKLKECFQKVLVIEDSLEICEFYKDFFDSEGLPFDCLHEIPSGQLDIGDHYDILICDWWLGSVSSKSWIEKLFLLKKLPAVTLVATGELGIENQLEGIPCKIVYKPFDFYGLTEILLRFKKNQ